MNRPNITNKQSACPACEYERGTIGQPVLEDGLMRCLECGSSWRELGNSVDHILKGTAYDARSEEGFDLESIYYPEEECPQNNSIFTSSKHQANGYLAIGRSSILVAIAGLLLIATLLFTLTSLPQASQSTSDGQLQIAQVRVQEQVYSQGEKIFTVKGILQNHSSNQERIPRITIILRQTNGREVVRWNYSSPTKSIQPGKNLTFASSIQYDTPYVAYAEASFN